LEAPDVIDLNGNPTNGPAEARPVAPLSKTKLFTVDQLAAELAVCRRSVYGLLQRPDAKRLLRPFRLWPGGPLRFRATDVDNYQRVRQTPRRD
jgi:hypothetical protein